MMHNTETGQTQGGIALAHAIPSAESCTISELVAFPSSLAALKKGIKWNASCWTANQRLNEFEQEQIGLHAFLGQRRPPHIEWCQFATDVDETISMLIVFPEMKSSFRSAELMERWTDTVVLPAFRAVGITDGTLTSNFRVIQMTAEAEREQTLNGFAPDTVLTETLRKAGGLLSQDLHNLWAAIQENANKTVFFDGFKNLFLVAIHRPPARTLQALPMDTAWRTVSSSWDSAIDMNFVPSESVRANAAVTISVQHIGTSVAAFSNGQNEVPSHRTTADSMWESSRKRRLDDDLSSDKRTKASDVPSGVVAPTQDDTAMEM